MPSAAHTTTASPIARMTAFSSAARACSAWASRWRRTWTSIRSPMSRAIATRAEPPAADVIGWMTISTVVASPSGRWMSTIALEMSCVPAMTGATIEPSRAASGPARTPLMLCPMSSSAVRPVTSQALRLTSLMSQVAGSKTITASTTVSSTALERSRAATTTGVGRSIGRSLVAALERVAGTESGTASRSYRPVRSVGRAGARPLRIVEHGSRQACCARTMPEVADISQAWRAHPGPRVYSGARSTTTPRREGRPNARRA